MKILVLLSIVGTLTMGANAQKVKESDVPTAVKNSFKKQYPTVNKTTWEKEGVNFEAEFDFDKAEMSVLINATGDILETEVEIGVDKLPANAASYISVHYQGKKIAETAKITDDKGTVTYEAELKGLDILFDDKGNFIKEEKDTKGEKGD